MAFINKVINAFKQIRPRTWLIVAILILAIIAIAPSAFQGLER
ncbi:hypothetical protein [Fructobacillus papyrifericola]|nr:hypothetical protein [Fructobacillus papyrifericola]